VRIKIDPLDALFSEYIRCRAIKEVHGCERCLAWKVDYKGLECSHFHGRAQKSTRWDEDNAADYALAVISSLPLSPMNIQNGLGRG